MNIKIFLLIHVMVHSAIVVFFLVHERFLFLNLEHQNLCIKVIVKCYGLPDK